MTAAPGAGAGAGVTRTTASTGIEAPMNRMGLQGAPVGSTVRPSAAPMAPAATPAAVPAASASVAPPAGPARSKRAARAYHKDASPALASSGWNLSLIHI